MSAAAPLTQAMIDVLDERRRQIYGEGYDEAHDDSHNRHQLAAAAAAYAFGASLPDFDRHALNVLGSHIRWRATSLWPFYEEEFKPKTRRQDMVRAAALLIAAIEREDRRAAGGA